MQTNKFNLVEGFYFPSYLDSNWLTSIKKEIWEEKEYNRFGIDISEGDIVLDLGANVGTFTHYALNKKAHHVYSFECNNNYFECLQLNCSLSKKVTLTKAFVTDRNEENHINIPNIFSTFNLGRVNFCKIDIEHWEYPLLLNTSSDYIKRIDKFAIEVHNIYKNSYKIFEIIEMFSKNNFSINFEHIHKDYNIAMLYAKNKNI